MSTKSEKAQNAFVEAVKFAGGKTESAAAYAALDLASKCASYAAVAHFGKFARLNIPAEGGA